MEKPELRLILTASFVFGMLFADCGSSTDSYFDPKTIECPGNSNKTLADYPECVALVNLVIEECCDSSYSEVCIKNQIAGASSLCASYFEGNDALLNDACAQSQKAVVCP